MASSVSASSASWNCFCKLQNKLNRETVLHIESYTKHLQLYPMSRLVPRTRAQRCQSSPNRLFPWTKLQSQHVLLRLDWYSWKMFQNVRKKAKICENYLLHFDSWRDVHMLAHVFPKSFSLWQTRGQHVHRHLQPTEVWHQQRDKFLDRTPQDDPAAAGKMSNFLSSQTEKNKLHQTSKFRFKSVSCQIGERKKHASTSQLQVLTELLRSEKLVFP